MAEIFDMLQADHRTVEQLFEQYRQSSDPGVALQICDELTVHAMLEEELVYPVLSSKVSGGMAQEARQEHQEAKQLISQIEAGISSGADVSSLVAELEQSMQHHVQEEETEVFPKMEQQLPDLVGQMGNDYRERRPVLDTQS